MDMDGRSVIFTKLNWQFSSRSFPSPGEFLYALGGFSQIRLLSAERYDTITGQWTSIANMNKHRSHACCVALGTKIYIMGGRPGN